jgi:2-(1,2-epoxy-1,2-dihydrophenyl)acetyl-CoA isomerase
MSDNNEVQYHFEPDSGIGRITFNRPQTLNAITAEFAGEFLSTIRALAQQEGLRCVVLKGEGRAFMAGGDVAAFAGGATRAEAAINELLDRLHPAILCLRELNAPIVSGVHGVAAGAGLSLALMADIVVAANDARFILAYDRLGTVPDCGGSWLLAHRVGYGRASELMMMGRTLSADEAQSWGIVNAIAPAASFEAELDKLARKLASGPSRAYGAFRQLLESATARSLAAQLEAERTAFIAMTKTHDFAEGVSAFLEKRPPIFQGI